MKKILLPAFTALFLSVSASSSFALDVPGMIKALGSADPAVYSDAEEKLVEAGPEAVPQLLGALQGGGKKLNIIGILAKIKDERAVRPLTGLLAVPDRELAQAAWGALVAMGEKSSLGLLEYLGTGKNPEYAAEALINIKPSGNSLEKARELLGSDDGKVRANAAYVLGAWGDAGSQDRIKATASHADAYVRETAVKAYGMVASKSKEYDKDFLMGLLGDGSPYIRRTAANMLMNVADKKGIIGPLTKLAVSDPDGDVREASLAALGSTGDKSVIPVLLKGLDDPHENAVISSLWYLDDLGAKGAAPLIVKLLESPMDKSDQLVREAFITLGGLAAEVDFGVILPYLERSDLHVKEEALRLVAARKKPLPRDVREMLGRLKARENNSQVSALYDAVLAGE